MGSWSFPFPCTSLLQRLAESISTRDRKWSLPSLIDSLSAVCAGAVYTVTVTSTTGHTGYPSDTRRSTTMTWYWTWSHSASDRRLLALRERMYALPYLLVCLLAESSARGRASAVGLTSNWYWTWAPRQNFWVGQICGLWLTLYKRSMAYNSQQWDWGQTEILCVVCKIQ